jgi:hypothetical protein
MWTSQEECFWVPESTYPFDLIRAVGLWIDDNAHYLHSALSKKTPKQVEGEYYTRYNLPFVAA